MTSANYRLSEALADRYAILRELGQGGMATVYLAEDVRHERKVALKVLRPELAAVLGAERFLKEIKTTANLQHPHILPLHDSGEAGGSVFYVMPYVEGESLRDRLSRDKQLSIDDAVRIAREVLSALDYAHRHSVVHRDIKPENILLHDGQAFVADFGIALAVSTAGAATRMTETGMSLGTPHYMSPEQAMGDRDISARSDVYAMGCVLYEMLLGEPPFTGPTAQAIIARVITEEPRRLTAQRKTIPPNVEAAVIHALAKLPADRFASAAEFSEALKSTAFVPTLSTEPIAASVPGPAKANWKQPIVTGSAAVALAAVAVAGWSLVRQPDAIEAPLVKFDLAHPVEDRLADGEKPFNLSPDGKTLGMILFRDGRKQIYLRRLADQELQPVDGTEGAIALMFSWDGEWIAFTRGTELFKVPVTGGVPTKIAVIPFTGAHGSWSPDGSIILSRGIPGVLIRVPASGGSFEELVRPDTTRGELAHYDPQVLPDGRHVLFSAELADGPRAAVLDLETRKYRIVEIGVVFGAGYSQGHLVWGQSNRVMAAPFDVSGARVTGPPAVVDSLPSGGQRTFWRGAFARGALALVSGAEVGPNQLVWFGRGDSIIPASPRRAYHNTPRLSPASDSKVAVISGSAIDVYDLDADRRIRVAESALVPAYSPDGRRIVYARGQGNELFVVPADGSAPAERIFSASPGSLAFPYDWSKDGTTIGYFELTDSTKRDIYLLRRDATTWKRIPFLVTKANERSPAFSPDGRWIAYTSDESGIDEVYVRAFPSGEGKSLVSRDGGREPVWSRSGRELFYRRGSEIFATGVVSGATFSANAPRRVFSSPMVSTTSEGPSGHRDWDVSRDGKSFIFPLSAQATTPFNVTVVLNFQKALKR